MKERTTAQLSTQKGRAAEGLNALTTAVRRTSQQLRNEHHDVMAQYVDRAAQQLERFSSTIRQRDVDDLMRDVRRFARRQPAVFIGGSFVAGMLTARLIKSSRQRRRDADAGDTSFTRPPVAQGTTGYSGATTGARAPGQSPSPGGR